MLQLIGNFQIRKTLQLKKNGGSIQNICREFFFEFAALIIDICKNQNIINKYKERISYPCFTY